MHVKKVTQKDRYGNTMSYEFEVPEKGIDTTALMKHQMDQMNEMLGEVPPIMDHPGEPRGSDTVPAWLTPGEFVVNAEAMRIPGVAEQIEGINDMGRQVQAAQGGSIPHHPDEVKYRRDHAHHMIPEHMDYGGMVPMMYDDGGWANTAWKYAKEYGPEAAEVIYDSLPIPFGGAIKGGAKQGWKHRGAIKEGAEDVYDWAEDQADEAAEWARDQWIYDQLMMTGDEWNDRYFNRYDNGGSVKDAFTTENLWRQAAEAAKVDPRGASETLANFPSYLLTAHDYIKYIPSFFGLEEGGEVPVPVSPTEALLHSREGYRPDVYLDTQSKPTVGYGHLLPAEYAGRVGEQPFTEDQLQGMFHEDMANAQAAARANVGEDTYKGLNKKQRAALDSMAFQLGADGQAKFKNMLAAIQAGDNARAALEALTGSQGGKSKWFEQTPTRALDLAEAFDPAVAARHRAGGGYMYYQDGGWSNFLNKYVLGDRTQIATDEIPYGWNVKEGRPYTHPEGVEAGTVPVPEEMFTEAGLDPNDPEVPPMMEDPYAEPVPAPVETPPYEGIGDWASQNLLGPKGRELTGTETEEELAARGARQEAGRAAEQRDERAAWNNPAYQEYSKRSLSTGQVPMPYAEWKEHHGSGAAEREAIFSNTPGATDQRAELAGSKATIELDSEGVVANEAAIAAASAAVEEGATVAEAAEAGKAAGKNAGTVLEKVIEDTEGEDTPDPNDPGKNNTPERVEEAGQQSSQQEKKKAEGFLKGIFGDLFDKGELGRMAIMYLGSRALGYSHGGSIRWAAKQYVNRVDAKSSAFNELVKAGKYTTASLSAYKDSGDPSDLIPVGAPTKRLGNFKTFYNNKGQRVRAEEVDIDGSKHWIGTNGQVINATYTEDASQVKGTKEYGERVKSDTTTYTNMLKGLRNTFGSVDPEDKSKGYRTDIVPEVQGTQIAKWALDNRIPPEFMGDIVQNAYQAALADPINQGKKVRDLTPYLEDQYVVSQVGDTSLFRNEDGSVVSGQKVAALFNAVDGAARKKGSELRGSALTTTALQAYREVWAGLSEKDQKQYAARAGEGETGFMQFIREDLSQ